MTAVLASHPLAADVDGRKMHHDGLQLETLHLALHVFHRLRTISRSVSTEKERRREQPHNSIRLALATERLAHDFILSRLRQSHMPRAVSYTPHFTQLTLIDLTPLAMTRGALLSITLISSPILSDFVRSLRSCLAAIYALTCSTLILLVYTWRVFSGVSRSAWSALVFVHSQ